MLAVTVARRTAAPGTELEFLVLACMSQGCVGIDLRSGALVRAAYPAIDNDDPMNGVARHMRSFTVASATIVGDDNEPEPIHPESVELASAPRVTGHMAARRAERWVRPLLHPRRQPLLGITGPAVPFWDLDGTRPSVAIVEPDRGPVVHSAEGSPRCRFAWRGLWHELPLTARPVTNARRMLVALTSPADGYCYKVVAGLLP
jgi:hypothetical protein